MEKNVGCTGTDGGGTKNPSLRDNFAWNRPSMRDFLILGYGMNNKRLGVGQPLGD